jgi:hypothetical protein
MTKVPRLSRPRRRGRRSAAVAPRAGRPGGGRRGASLRHRPPLRSRGAGCAKAGPAVRTAQLLIETLLGFWSSAPSSAAQSRLSPTALASTCAVAASQVLSLCRSRLHPRALRLRLRRCQRPLK